jgi:AraC-like DNA-binding protein
MVLIYNIIASCGKGENMSTSDVQNNSFSNGSGSIFFVDTNQRELTEHGSEDFPCTCYLDQYYNSSFPWHWHDELELAFVQKGSLMVSMNEQRYVLQEGNGIFINSGVLHSYTGLKNIECLFPNVLFHISLICGTQKSILWKKYLQPLLETVSLSHLILQEDIPWQKDALDFIKEVYNLLQRKEWGYEFMVVNNLSEILLLFCKNHSDLLSEINTHNKIEISRLRQMLDYIQCHYTEQIQLQQIADAASVSQRECLRCFKSVIGTPPMQYVINLRIRKAKKLLIETTLSLSEICERCGFQNQSYFTKVFRSITNTSPGKYRKKRL